MGVRLSARRLCMLAGRADRRVTEALVIGLYFTLGFTLGLI